MKKVPLWAAVALALVAVALAVGVGARTMTPPPPDASRFPPPSNELVEHLKQLNDAEQAKKGQ